MSLLTFIKHGFGFTIGARVAQDALEALDEETRPLSPREQKKLAREQKKLAKAKAKAETRERKRREADVEAQLRDLKKKAKP